MTELNGSVDGVSFCSAALQSPALLVDLELLIEKYAPLNKNQVVFGITARSQLERRSNTSTYLGNRHSGDFNCKNGL